MYEDLMVTFIVARQAMVSMLDADVAAYQKALETKALGKRGYWLDEETKVMFQCDNARRATTALIDKLIKYQDKVAPFISDHLQETAKIYLDEVSDLNRRISLGRYRNQTK